MKPCPCVLFSCLLFGADPCFCLRRVWQGLLLAAYMNTQSDFYYGMLSNFMGQGDKETFHFALLAANTSYHVMATPVGSVGLTKCGSALTSPPPEPLRSSRR